MAGVTQETAAFLDNLSQELQLVIDNLKGDLLLFATEELKPPVTHSADCFFQGFLKLSCTTPHSCCTGNRKANFVVHYQFPQGWEGEGNRSPMNIDLQGLISPSPWESLFGSDMLSGES